jgi:hypothetical protein
VVSDCKVICKEALTAAETLLYFMENQDDADHVDLSQISPTEKSNKIHGLSDKMTLRKIV